MAPRPIDRPVATPDPAAGERAGSDSPRVVDFDELLGGSADVAPVAGLADLGVVDRPPARVADLGEAAGVAGARSRHSERDASRGGGSGRRRLAVIAGSEPGTAAGAASRPRTPITGRGDGSDDPRSGRGADPDHTESSHNGGDAHFHRTAGPDADQDVRPAAEGGAGADQGPAADPESVARAICLRLLTDRARTRQELAQALRRKGVPDASAHTVLERFDDVGLIDDGAFAEQWVHSRHTVHGLGRRALAAELRRKGVADEVAGEVLAGVDDESEEWRARELVERKLRNLRTDTDGQRAAVGRKLVGMLARKGYGGGVAYRVVREALAAHGAELDELGSEPPTDE